MKAAVALRELFGRRLYIELWDHRMPGDDVRNDLLSEVAGRLRIATVATNNAHYHDRVDADLSEVLAAVAGRRSLAEQDGFRPATDERYLKSPAEMRQRFARYSGAEPAVSNPARRQGCPTSSRSSPNWAIPATSSLSGISSRLPDRRTSTVRFEAPAPTRRFAAAWG